jgi:hypothetical protein
MDRGQVVPLCHQPARSSYMLQSMGGWNVSRPESRCRRRESRLC